jgi:hypothetical protein
MKLRLLSIGILFSVFASFAQSPDWPAIKAQAKPFVHDTVNYGTPYIQDHHNLGWEDGMFMSRDGLHMYAFYFPADLILFFNYLSNNPICPPIHPYVRGPLLGIDTLTNPWGCASLLHSDIIYATRSDTSLPFQNWQASNLANPTEFEGGPQSVANADGSLEFFVYTQSDSSQTDIYWYRDTSNNPHWPGTLMPSPVNSRKTYEDNPHLERINDSTLVLLLDDHADPAYDANIYYSVSYDDGFSWSPKSYVTTVNTTHEDIQPHLWSDGLDYYLYFVAPDTNDVSNRLSIYRMRQSIAGDWDSWTDREMVISAGTISDTSGFAAAVGEPSLTEWGDISFVLAIQALGTTDTTDQFELDPWYLPRKTPIVKSVEKRKEKNFSVNVYPNPSSGEINITSSTPINQIIIHTSIGELVYCENLNGQTSSLLSAPSSLIDGLYFISIQKEKGIETRKLILKRE